MQLENNTLKVNTLGIILSSNSCTNCSTNCIFKDLKFPTIVPPEIIKIKELCNKHLTQDGNLLIWILSDTVDIKYLVAILTLNIPVNILACNTAIINKYPLVFSKANKIIIRSFASILNSYEKTINNDSLFNYTTLFIKDEELVSGFTIIKELFQNIHIDLNLVSMPKFKESDGKFSKYIVKTFIHSATRNKWLNKIYGEAFLYYDDQDKLYDKPKLIHIEKNL